jgi:Excalibur calcium-binding domain
VADIKDFDKSRRTHWRSDDDLERIHANLPWNKKATVKWGLVAAALIGAGAVTQLVIWETQRAEARSALLSTVAQGTVFAGCNEVRARGLAPLRRGEPGYGEHMDGDGDGEACEPLVGMEAGSEMDADF